MKAQTVRTALSPTEQSKPDAQTPCHQLSLAGCSQWPGLSILSSHHSVLSAPTAISVPTTVITTDTQGPFLFLTHSPHLKVNQFLSILRPAFFSNLPLLAHPYSHGLRAVPYYFYPQIPASSFNPYT